MRRHPFPLRLPVRHYPVVRLAAALISTLMIGLPAALAEETTNDILAIVNGCVLPLEDAQRQFDYYAPLYQALGQGDALDGLRRDLARQSVRRALILSDCRRLGLKLTPEDRLRLRSQAEAEYHALLCAQTACADTQISGLRQAAAEITLAQNGFTAALLYERLCEDELLSRHKSFITDDLEIDEATLRAAFETRVSAQKIAYEQNPALFEHDVLSGKLICYIPEGTRRIRHLLILADPDDQLLLEESLAEVGPLNESAARVIEPLLERAQSLLDLLEQGESFAALMSAYQDDSRIRPSPLTAGEYGYVARTGGLWDDKLRSAAQAIKQNGDLSAPIVTALGVHLIQLVDQSACGSVSFESVRARLSEELTAEAQTACYEERIAMLFDTADILWYDDNLAYPDEAP